MDASFCSQGLVYRHVVVDATAWAFTSETGKRSLNSYFMHFVRFHMEKVTNKCIMGDFICFYSIFKDYTTRFEKHPIFHCNIVPN